MYWIWDLFVYNRNSLYIRVLFNLNKMLWMFNLTEVDTEVFTTEGVQTVTTEDPKTHIGIPKVPITERR